MVIRHCASTRPVWSAAVASSAVFSREICAFGVRRLTTWSCEEPWSTAILTSGEFSSAQLFA